MKKIVLILVIIIVLFSGCAGSKSKLSLDDAISAYVDAGAELIDPPMYQMIYATDGAMLRYDGKNVKLYEYSSEDNYKKGLEILPAMEKYPRIDNIVFEVYTDSAMEICESLK